MTLPVNRSDREVRLSERAKALIGASLSPETQRVYRFFWGRWFRYCDQESINPDSPEPADIANYLALLSERGKKISYINSSLCAIKKALSILKVEPNPCESVEVKQALEGARREPNRKKQAPALLPVHFEQIIKHLTSEIASESRDLLEITRDMALVMLLYDAGLRRSEASALEWRDIVEWADGTGRLIIQRSKTDQRGETEQVFIREKTSVALRNLRQINPNQANEDRVFDRSADTLNRRFKKLLKSIGLEGYSIHSGRVGMARRMKQNGAPDTAIMKQGRWKGPAMVAHYTKGEEAGEVGKYV